VSPTKRPRIGIQLILAGLLLWAALPALGLLNDHFPLDLGSITTPQPGYLRFLTYYSILGGAGAILLASGLDAACHGRFVWRGFDERAFLVVAVGLAILIPAALRAFLLQGMPLADDETLYRFSAELLASGRLYARSHPLKLFFDHIFLINDGRVYSQYFLGWPALMAPGVRLGVHGYENALIAGLTIPGLYGLAKEFMSRRWAQIAVVLMLASPMLQMMAATRLSHTATVAALTWAAFFAVRAARSPTNVAVHAGFGLMLSVAFFIRPLSVIGIGTPFLVLWFWGLLRQSNPVLPRLMAFALPVTALAALFLWINWAQTGHALKPAYQAFQSYAAQNDYRFSGLNVDRATEVANLAFKPDTPVIFALGVFRLNFALFGWPLSFLFLLFAVRAKKARVLWAALALFWLVHVPLKDTGIDTFGPVHLTELAIPVILLSGVGLERLHRWFRWRAPEHRLFPLTLLGSLILGASLLYVPHRFRAVAQIARSVKAPLGAVEDAGLTNAVVFASPPFAPSCTPDGGEVPSHFVFWWPMNDPDLRNDLIWANHLSSARDRELMEFFPARAGYVAHWTEDCRMQLIPLDHPSAAEIPNGQMRYYLDRRELYTDAHSPTGELPPASER
jgi:hypothetical protein